MNLHPPPPMLPIKLYRNWERGGAQRIGGVACTSAPFPIGEERVWGGAWKQRGRGARGRGLEKRGVARPSAHPHWVRGNEWGGA